MRLILDNQSKHVTSFRMLQPHERITDNSYHCYMGDDHPSYDSYTEANLKDFGWLHTRAVGELVNDHLDRIYIEVTE